VNWCIENNHPCIGCCEPEFPDATSPMFAKTPDDRAPALRSDGAGGLEPVNRVLAKDVGEGE
jgi:hydrogenase small subunit